LLFLDITSLYDIAVSLISRYFDIDSSTLEIIMGDKRKVKKASQKAPPVETEKGMSYFC
jgi:hypothetical protein